MILVSNLDQNINLILLRRCNFGKRCLHCIVITHIRNISFVLTTSSEVIQMLLCIIDCILDVNGQLQQKLCSLNQILTQKYPIPCAPLVTIHVIPCNLFLSVVTVTLDLAMILVNIVFMNDNCCCCCCGLITGLKSISINHLKGEKRSNVSKVFSKSFLCFSKAPKKCPKKCLKGCRTVIFLGIRNCLSSIKEYKQIYSHSLLYFGYFLLYLYVF